MFRHHAFLTTLLTVATAVALFASGWIMATPAVADPRPDTTAAVVRDFYAAVNATIRTGDTAALESAMDEHVITHGPLATIAPDRAGLIHYLSSLHENDPYLALDVTEISMTGDRAVVDVRVLGAAEGAFLGSSLRDVPLWSTVDAFRIGNRRVLEFWSDATGLALLESQTSVPVAFERPLDRQLTLDHVTIAPEEKLIAAGQAELRWLLAETDHISVTTTPNPEEDWATPTAAPSSHETRLHAGELLALPMWSRTEVRNTEVEPASLLVLTVAEPPEEVPYYEQNPQSAVTASGAISGWPIWRTGLSLRQGGATITTLTGNYTTAIPEDQTVLAVARVTLAPGAVLTGIALTGPCLLAVDSGTLDLFASGEPAQIYQGKPDYLDAGTLAAETGALLPIGAIANLHNPGVDPTVVTLIAILPANAMTGGNA
jgi:SnoaL-like domain